MPTFSLPVFRWFDLDSSRLVIGACTGALIRYRGERVIITVAHSTDNGGNWGALERFDPAAGRS